MTATLPATNHTDTQESEVSIELLGPDEATTFLATQAPNRRLDVRHQANLAKAMRQGTFRFDGAPIRFDTQGRLIDGQHRMGAVVDSGTTHRFVVVRRLPPSAQRGIDIGKRRTPEDHLAIAGYRVTPSVAASIRLYVVWHTGGLWTRAKNDGLSAPETVEWAERHVEALPVLDKYTRGGFHYPAASPRFQGAAALTFHLIDAEQTEQFFTMFSSGANLDSDSPILALRNKFARERVLRMRQLPLNSLSAFVIAWNAWRRGDHLKQIKSFPETRWTPATFPKAR